MEIVSAAFIILFILLFLGVPIGFAMAAVGAVGYALLVNWNASLGVAAEVIFKTAQSYELSVIPLFILMGNFITRSQLSEDLYAASYAFLGHRRGGLAMATIVACAGFAAVCGSSIATAATMAKVAIPQMERYGYGRTLAAGTVAAGGTLGILIPPSAVLVLYGIITSTDIGRLFIAGILPGLLGMLCYLGAVLFETWRNPSLGPPGARSEWKVRWHALSRVWAVLVLFLLILGGLYAGIFSATEAAGVGATGAFLFALWRRTLTLRSTIEVLVDSGMTTAMLMTILFGALVFANLINIAAIPNLIVDWLENLQVQPLTVVIVIMLIYIVLGCFVESISMMLLTVPIFFPVVAKLGVDAVWFGILVVVVIEISLITPPVGLNIFVLNALLPEYSLRTIYRGVLSFVAADFVRLTILILFPSIALVLPRMMN